MKRLSTQLFNSFSRFAAGKQAGSARCGRLETTTTGFRGFSTSNKPQRPARSGCEKTTRTSPHDCPTCAREYDCLTCAHELVYVEHLKTYVPMSLIENSSTDTYARHLQASRNRAMHTLNGNPPKAKVVVVEKKKGTSKKAANRQRRGQQLAKQVQALTELQKEGNSKAVALGRLIKGRGDYEIGRNLGSKAGAFIGEKIHKWISQIFGSGDYNIHSADGGNAAKLLARASSPTFNSNPSGGVMLKEVDYIGSFDEKKDFNCITFPIDLSSSLTFPWAYIITRRFQQYKLHGCVFFVTSLVSEYTTNVTVGSIFGSVRYDVDSPAPTSKRDVMNALFCSSEKASKSNVFAVECADAQTPTRVLKVRQPGQSTGDEQLYKLGFFDLCTQGAPANVSNAYDVSVAYEVEYFKQRLYSSSGMLNFFADLRETSNGPLVYVANTANVKQPRVNNLGITINGATSEIFFPFDTEIGSVFFIYLNHSILGGSPQTYSISAGSYTSTCTAFNNQSNYSLATANSASSGTMSLMAAIRVEPGATLATPPRVVITATGVNSNGPGNITICQMDRQVASGLVVRPPQLYRRYEFLDYLVSRAEGCHFDGFAPDLARFRLVDYVDAFRRENTIDLNLVDRSSSEYDVGINEALALMERFIEERKVDRDPWDVARHGVPEQSRTVRNVTPPNSPLGGEEVVVHSQINGNNGEWTNTDDIKIDWVDSESHQINLLPQPVADFHNSTLVHAQSGHRHPRFSFVLREYDWFTPAGCLVDVGTITPIQSYTLTGRQMRQLQCFLITGRGCFCERVRCPGAWFLRGQIKERDLKREAEHAAVRDQQLNGNNGSHTGSDDVFLQCQRPCAVPSHYHRIHRQALTGAARRDAERPRAPDDTKHKPKFLRCPVPTTCPEETHYHPQSQDDQADVEAVSDRVSKQVRDILQLAQQNAALDALGEQDATEARRELDDEEEQDAKVDDKDIQLALQSQPVPGSSLTSPATTPGKAENVMVCQPCPSNPQEYARPPAANPPHLRAIVKQPKPMPVWAGRLWQEMKAEEERKGHNGYGSKQDIPAPRSGKTQDYNQKVPARAEILRTAPAPAVTPAQRPHPHQLPAPTHQQVIHQAVNTTVLPDAPIPGIDEKTIPELLTPHHRQQWHVIVHNIGHDRLSEMQKECDLSTELKGQRAILGQSEEYRTAVNTYLEKIRAFRDDGRIPRVTLPPIQIGNRLHPTLHAYANVYGLLHDHMTRGNGRQDPLPPVVQDVRCPCGVQLGGRNGCLTACDHWFCAACVCENTTNDTFECPVCGATEHLDSIHARHAVLVRELHVAPRPPPNAPPGGPPEENEQAVDWSGSDIPEAYWCGVAAMIAYRRRRRIDRANDLVFAAGAVERNPPAVLYYRPDENRYPRRAYTMSDLLVYRRFPLAPVVARVSSLLVNRVERLASRFAEIGGPVTAYHFHNPRTPRSLGHLAPRAPPLCMAPIDLEDAIPVTIFTNTDIDDRTPLLIKAARFCSRIIPFLHPTEEWQLGDDSTQASYDTEYVEEGTRSLGYRLAVWRADHTSTVLSEGRVHTAQTMLSSLFGASRLAYVNRQIVEFLGTTGTQNLKNLHVRAAAFREEKKYTPAQGLINAAMRCLVGEEFYDGLNQRAAQVAADSVRYFCQLRYFKSIGDLMTVPVPRLLDFQVGARSAASRTTGALSGLVESKPSSRPTPLMVD